MRSNENQNISVIIPVIRPEKALALTESIYANAGIPRTCYEIVMEQDHDRIGCPKMVRRLVDRAKYDLVCFLGDDTIMQPDCLKNALDAMATLPDGWGLVGLNDGSGRKMPTHWLATKALQQYVGGEFFHTGYTHCFCDRELWDRAEAMGRYVWAENAVVQHDHPMFKGGIPDDPDLKRVYSPKVFEADQRLYWQRKADRNGFKLGIAFPIMGNTGYWSFFLSLLLAATPPHTLLIPKFPVGEFPHDIGVVRDNLVFQALEQGCTHLIMMDTDQVYPRDTILRLLEHDKDIVGTVVHRRYEPFDPILYRGELEEYYHVPDEDAYSGDLIEVDSTGTGCVLFKTRIFADIKPPWFRVGLGKTGKPIGEDIAFFAKARAAGYRIYIDTAIQVDHLAMGVVNRGMYEMYKAAHSAGFRPATVEEKEEILGAS